MQAKEKEVKKNLGVGGARGFKSRSFNSFVEALEKGEATHLFAVDPRKVKSGEIPLKDVPSVGRAARPLTNRGDAGAATWLVRGDGSRHRRGRDLEIPRGGAAAAA